MHVKIVLGLLLFCTFYQYGFTCACFPMTLEQKYCRSDFMIKIRVRSKLKNPSGQQDFFNDFYKIRIKDTWKFRYEDDVTQRNRLYTASDGVMCGVYLQRGKRYIVSGRVDRSEGKMRIDLCNSIVDQKPFDSSTKLLKSSPPNCLLVGKDKLLSPGKK